MITLGCDIGYSQTKVVAQVRGERVEKMFPSIVGTANVSRFSVLPSQSFLICENGNNWMIGKEAIDQSRFVLRREDRNWIDSEQWYLLFLAALSELSDKGKEDVTLVTGLPVSFYASDKQKVYDRLKGTHKFSRDNNDVQQFEVTECRVIPQPFGTLLNETLNEQGKIVNEQYLEPTGIIDAGSKTVNILTVKRLAEVARDTTSIDTGGWDVMRALRDEITSNPRFTGVDLNDHEWVEAVITNSLWYGNEKIDITDMVTRIVEPLANEIIARATQLWNGGKGLRQILVTGGGALLIGEWVIQHFDNAKIVKNPVMSNANGYFRFAQKVAGG